MNDGQQASLIWPDWPAPACVQAVSTTRQGGVSNQPWDTFNLANHVGDNEESVVENRRRLKDALHLPNEPVWLEQVHGNRVTQLPCENLVASDASYTQRAGKVCAVLTADCLPLLMCNQTGDEVAAIHAGWRGLAAGVIESTLEVFECQSDQLLVWLGPAIGPQSFEVGHEVYETFTQITAENRHAFEPHEDRWYCNIYELARIQLSQLGVNQVYGGNLCTYQDQERFYSYRRDDQTGRMASLIWINP